MQYGTLSGLLVAQVVVLLKEVVKEKVVYGMIAEQVFVDDAFQDLRRNAMIPQTVRIDGRDGAVSTNPQTWRFSPFYTVGIEK